MARNEEKAHGLLNRWSAYKQELLFGAKQQKQVKRPKLTSECDSLPQAERWRRQVLKEIAEKVAVIQNASLGEHRLRELNDEINKLLRERSLWEKRITNLGGVDYSTVAPPAFDADGRTLQGSDYKYFGATKDLPGVRELFEPDREAAKQRKRNRDAIYGNIKPSYYGLDNDDGDLLLREAEVERKLVARAVHEYNSKMAKRENVETSESESEEPVAEIDEQQEKKDTRSAKTDVSKSELENMILERKRKELLAKYA